MATTAFGIMQDSSGNGTSPHALRKCIQSRWNNAGIVTGLEVTGRSDLKYSVSAGVAVVSRSDADGFAEAYWEGGETDAVSAGDPSNPRIDLVWIKANDLQQGDPDNLVHIGVESGTPGASPVAPACPSGCTPVAYMLVPANATSTSSCAVSDGGGMAIPYGASMGMLGQYQDNYEADQEWIRKWYSQSSISVTVPTDRLVEIVYTARTYTESELDSSYYLKAQVDGQDITDGMDERPVFGRIWLRDEWRIITELSAGTHTIAIQLMPNTNEAQFTWAGIRSTQVWDRGVA